MPVAAGRIAAGTVLLAAMLAASPASGLTTGDVHGEGGGRLSASSGGGGFVADAPVHRPYWVSNGDWMLCDAGRDDGQNPDGTITITGVRPVFGEREPLEVRTYLRTVTPRQVAEDQDAPRYSYGPYIAALGRPPHFAQSYAAGDGPRGHFRRGVAGTVVDLGCDETSSAASASGRGRAPAHRWLTLVLAIKVGPEGARVRRTLVDYEIDGEPHTLRIDWTVGGQGYHRPS
jgi:hypothetical protein